MIATLQPPRTGTTTDKFHVRLESILSPSSKEATGQGRGPFDVVVKYAGKPALYIHTCNLASATLLCCTCYTPDRNESRRIRKKMLLLSSLPSLGDLYTPTGMNDTNKNTTSQFDSNGTQQRTVKVGVYFPKLYKLRGRVQLPKMNECESPTHVQESRTQRRVPRRAAGVYVSNLLLL